MVGCERIPTGRVDKEDGHVCGGEETWEIWIGCEQHDSVNLKNTKRKVNTLVQ